MLPLAAGLAMNAGASLIDGFAQKGANKKRQNIVNQGIQAQQGFRNDMIGATDGALNNMGSVKQAVGNRTQAVNTAIGDTLQNQTAFGAPKAYQLARGKMALNNANRKSALAQALGGQQGFQSSNFQDGMQRSQLGSQLGDINRESQARMFQDQQRMNDVRPNAGMQFLSEGLRLGSALGGVL